MARRSRKKTNEVVIQPAKVIAPDSITRIPTAAYARLSRENNGGVDTDSLDTQISYLCQYIKEHPEYELTEVYADNGHTGTDFERSEFQRLMQDVSRGKISCIVVKDLSRFGRNYIETGYYIENILPKLNVKLIAINDNFDSSRESDRNGIATPIKNMVNEMYARDLSKKIRATQKEKRKCRDKLPHGVAPYGYCMNEDKSQYLVNEEVADYVRMIFQWSIIGDGNVVIAKRLNFIRAITAGEIAKTTQYALKRRRIWDSNKVYDIITNPVHTGDLCYGRTHELKFDVNAKRGWLDKKDWVIHKNTHEPLVPRDDYWELRERVKERRKKKGSNEPVPERDKLKAEFPKMVYCAKCGHYMLFSKLKHDYANNGNYYAAYTCSGPKMLHCNKVVHEDFLKIITMEQVRFQMSLFCDRAKEIGIDSNGKKNPLLSVEKKLNAANTNIVRCKEKLAKLYEDFAVGIIEETDYQIVKEKYIVEEQQCEDKVSILMEEKRELENRLNEIKELTMEYGRKKHIPEFDGELVRSMVKRIAIYEENKVEIEFKNNDLMDYLERLSVGKE